MLKGKKLGNSQELRANIEGSELRDKKKNKQPAYNLPQECKTEEKVSLAVCKKYLK